MIIIFFIINAVFSTIYATFLLELHVMSISQMIISYYESVIYLILIHLKVYDLYFSESQISEGN